MMTPCKLVDISPLTRVKWTNFLTGYVPTTTSNQADCFFWGLLTLSFNGKLCWVPKFERYELGKNFPHISQQPFSLKKLFTGTWKKHSYSFQVRNLQSRTYESFNSMWSFVFKKKAVIHPTTHIFQPSWVIGGCETRQVHRLAVRCFLLLRLWLSPPKDGLLTTIHPLNRKINIESPQ